MHNASPKKACRRGLSGYSRYNINGTVFKCFACFRSGAKSDFDIHAHGLGDGPRKFYLETSWITIFIEKAIRLITYFPPTKI